MLENGARESGRKLIVRASCSDEGGAHDALIAQVFTSFDEYDNDPDRLNAVHEELLRLLAE